jgi:hypothetical protein
MANVIIKTDERRAAERASLRAYGIDPRRATPLQRNYAERIVADEREMKNEVNLIREKTS